MGHLVVIDDDPAEFALARLSMTLWRAWPGWSRLERQATGTLWLAETGAQTAREMYGARGWMAHHNTDLWRATAPIDGAQWGMWPMGGAWLCTHLWARYDYGRDLAFLRQASGAETVGQVGAHSRHDRRGHHVRRDHP